MCRASRSAGHTAWSFFPPEERTAASVGCGAERQADLPTSRKSMESEGQTGVSQRGPAGRGDKEKADERVKRRTDVVTR